MTTLLIAILVVQIVAFVGLWLLVTDLRERVDRLYDHLRSFDSGVARSFDSTDAEIAVIKDEVTARRCQAGGCAQRATYSITSENGTLYTCAAHDIWREDPSVVRSSLHR